MSDKTEQPTPKRLREARKKGQVLKSQDVTAAAMFLGGVALLGSQGPSLMETSRQLLVASFQPEFLRGSVTADTLLSHLGASVATALWACVPLAGGLVAIAIAVNFAQVKMMFSFALISPKLEKLNPLTGFKNLFFSSRTYIELIKTVLKFGAIGWLLYAALQASARDLVLASRVSLVAAVSLTSVVLWALLYKTAAGLVVVGAVDYLIQRKMHLKQLMMSKDEVMREFKEDEGDPHIKHQRKHLHQEMMNEDIRHRVPKSAAVVVNPTHLAVALEYDENTMAAPVVGMKGKDRVAQRIIETAKEHRVPVIRNVSLAWRLNDVETDGVIPEDLYEPVAEVLRWVAELEREQEQR